MEEKKMGAYRSDKVVNGVAVGLEDPENPTVLLVENLDNNKAKGWGTPGGIVEQNEELAEALNREWKEEIDGRVNPQILGCIGTIEKCYPEKHYQSFFCVEDTGKPLRKKGTPETGPPTRVPLRKVASGEIPVFLVHLLAIYAVVRILARHNKEMAFIAVALAKKLAKNVEEES